MSRSQKHYPKVGGPDSGKFFKSQANGKVRQKSKLRIHCYLQAERLEELVLPLLDEVSNLYDIDYWVEYDPDRIAKALRK